MNGNCLVISAVGEDRPGIVKELSKALLERGCNIADSRMTVLGGEFALILMAEGSAEAIAATKALLPELQQQLGLTIIARQTQRRPAARNLVPYEVEVVAMDHPGIVHDVAQFLAGRGINIEDMDTSTYAAPHTGTPMFSLHMTVSVPADVPVSRLREQFLDFCDELNLDATLDPVR